LFETASHFHLDVSTAKRLFSPFRSAVDAHVGSRIFNDAICGVLYSKTRLLVTHGLQYITRAHSIYVLQEGTIAERGTFDELVSRPNSLLSAVVATYESEAKDAYDEAKV
jgi:ABC-type multidrug transport system fused ATPase/permease subunit